MIRVCIAGVTGWTGRAVAQAVDAATDLELVSGVSRSDPASFSSVADALGAATADVLVAPQLAAPNRDSRVREQSADSLRSLVRPVAALLAE